MNWWLTAMLSLIFTGLCGTLAVNTICNHITDIYHAAIWGIPDKKLANLAFLAERFAAVMLCGLTASGFGCLIFSAIKLIGG